MFTESKHFIVWIHELPRLKNFLLSANIENEFWVRGNKLYFSKCILLKVK